MTRTNLAPPAETSPTNETTLVLRLARLAEAVENLTAMQAADTLELRCFTPAQAGAILGKSENWVVEAIQDDRVPHTYIGKSPRMTAAHIRWVQAQGECLPNQYAKPIAA
ncbi:hypothetical protein [Streptomyces sp. NPDC056817]|uniref:hypothetical protein n=1 Tax=Streptomyces sp. NPDC056817 TaxID=3345950 RepID=UPI00367B0237